MNDQHSLHDDVAEILLTESEIAAKVQELGARISADYGGRPLTLVSVLKGSLPFMADLMRAIEIPIRIDLMEVSSYGGATTESSGLVRILKDLSASIAGEDVLIVEDIIDTGLTLNYLIRYLRGKGPAIAADLHAARQAGPPPGRDPGRLHRLHDPRPVRGRLRTRLRRALSQPAIRGGAQTGGLFRRPRRMTLHRRPLGRGRTLAAVGGALMVVGCVLPWWQVGGTPGIPPISGDRHGRDRHPGLPRRHRRDGAGRPPVRGGRSARSDSIAGCRSRSWPSPAGSASALRVVELANDGAFQFSSAAAVFTNGPGLWVAAIGLVVLSRATWTMTREPIYR